MRHPLPPSSSAGCLHLIIQTRRFNAEQEVIKRNSSSRSARSIKSRNSFINISWKFEFIRFIFNKSRGCCSARRLKWCLALSSFAPSNSSSDSFSIVSTLGSVGVGAKNKQWKRFFGKNFHCLFPSRFCVVPLAQLLCRRRSFYLIILEKYLILHATHVTIPDSMIIKIN